MNHYEILGVKPDATDSEIKKGFRKKARKTHPDVNHNPDAAEKFDRVQKAFLVLSDKNKRAYFDANGTDLEENDQPDSIAILMEIFDGAIKLVILGHSIQLGTYIRENLNTNITRIKASIPDIDSKVDRLKKMQGTITFTGDGVNFMEERVESLLSEATQARRTVETRLSHLNAAKELLVFFTFSEIPSSLSQVQNAYTYRSFHRG